MSEWSNETLKRVGAVIEEMESRYPESVIAAAVLAEVDRFESFHVAELQQLLASVMLAIRCRIIRPGEGNLLPGFAEEINRTLKEKSERE